MNKISGLRHRRASWISAKEVSSDPRGSTDLTAGLMGDHSKIPVDHSKIAVIGSGPAGLSCAAELARLGHDVTVFEALHGAGGLLMRGIPEFHLPVSASESGVGSIHGLGVTFRSNRTMGKSATIHDLIACFGYRAAFIAAGAGSPLSLDLPGIDLNGVYHAPEFLTRLNLLESQLFRNGRSHRLPVNHVVVVGDGDSALECSRASRRVGAQEVTVVCRRSLQDLRVRREDVEVAQEEGIQFLYLTAPLRLLGDEDKYLRRVECAEICAGRRSVAGGQLFSLLSGTEFQLPAEICVIAIGQRPTPVPGSLALDLETDEEGRIVVDPKTHQTSISGVFAGGDIGGDKSITAAMEDGQEAARGIHNFLSLTKQ